MINLKLIHQKSLLSFIYIKLNIMLNIAVDRTVKNLPLGHLNIRKLPCTLGKCKCSVPDKYKYLGQKNNVIN